MYSNHRIGTCRYEEIEKPGLWSWYACGNNATTAATRFNNQVGLLTSGEGENPIHAVIWIQDTINMDTGTISSTSHGFKKAQKKNVIHYNQQTITTPSPVAVGSTFNFTAEIYEALTQ